MNRLRFACLAAVALLASPAFAAEPNKYLPEDTTVIVSVNVRQVLDSALVKKYGQDAIKTALDQNQDLQKLLKATGLDPQKDIDLLIIGSPGNPTDKAVVLLQGKFDAKKIHAAADSAVKANPRQMVLHKEGELRIYENKAAARPGFAALVDDQTLMVAQSKDAITGALKGPRLKKEMAEVVKGVDDKQAIWLAALVPSEVKKMLAKQKEVAELADKINAITGTVGVDKDLAVAINTQMADAKSASDLKELLAGVQGLGKLYAGAVPDYGKLLGDIVEAIKVGADKSKVTLTVSVTDKMIADGLKPMPKKPGPSKPR